jgi:hypothetical protein
MGKDEQRSIEVVPLQMNIKGGEYLEDIEEVHNILCYGMGVQGSVVGSVPGKGSNMSGTDKRELFAIKQALCKPLRDRLLKPFEIIRDYNGWSDKIEFVVEDMTFTTLDEEASGQKITVND